MDPHDATYAERPLVKTKIIATVGPACGSREQLKKLAITGVDIFRLNFAHGSHDWLDGIVRSVRVIEEEIGRPIGLLGDLSGPKIRLGELPEEGIMCQAGETFEFVHEADPDDPRKLTSSYDALISDVRVGDRLLLADGTVWMQVIEKPEDGQRIICQVQQPGLIRTRQGINLPGAVLSTPSLTEADREDLAWALKSQLDFVGLSFVRSADDIRLLRRTIEEAEPETKPAIVAKIEKMEAVSDLENILEETDAVMVARGDLGVEVDIARVPTLQKRIIRLCNQHRIPVITATQMLDSMQDAELPTRAEASDVANAVLDGSDAVMLSGETAIGRHPERTVAMMSRITIEAERLVATVPGVDSDSTHRTRAALVTEAVTLGAATAGEHLDADLIVVATHSGRTAMAVSKQRSTVPVLALTDNWQAARRMCLFWGVTPVVTEAVTALPAEIVEFVVKWGREQGALESGSRIILVGSTDWSMEGKNLMLVHAVP